MTTSTCSDATRLWTAFLSHILCVDFAENIFMGALKVFRGIPGGGSSDLHRDGWSIHLR
jgi:hypothetical protein